MNRGKKIVVGRDGRISGDMVNALVVSTLRGLGLDVIDLGLSTTPTVELAVTGEKAAGGIILTASHNPQEWNALKLLNAEGEFVSAQEGAAILEKAQKEDFVFAPVDRLGDYRVSGDWLNGMSKRLSSIRWWMRSDPGAEVQGCRGCDQFNGCTLHSTAA